MASQKRSSSAFDSRSVGSIISVPGTGNRMVGAWEAVVDQAFGDVVDGDAAGVFQRAGIDDALMRDAALALR